VGSVLIPLAAVAWLGCFVPWALRYVPLYLQPSADESPD